MKWVIQCMRKYADFSGRAGIAECFVFLFFVFVCLSVTFGVDLFLGWGKENVVDWVAWFPTFEITRLVIVLPFFAVTARRLHDTNRTGWLSLLWFVPIVGWGYLLMLLAQPGHPTSNRYGAPTEDASDDSGVVAAS